MPMYWILLPCLWPGAPSLLLLIVRQATKTNMQDCWSFAALQAASLEPLAHRRNVASFLKSFVCIGIIYFADVLQKLVQLVPLPFSRCRSALDTVLVILIDCMIFLWPFLIGKRLMAPFTLVPISQMLIFLLFESVRVLF